MTLANTASRISLGERVTIGVLLASFVFGVAVAISAGNAFGYDESVYALLSRHWTAQTPASGWDFHRPPLLSIVGVGPALSGWTAEWPFRLIALLFAVATFGASWAFARAAGGVLSGLIVAFVIASSSPLQVEGASFLTDVPSTFLLIVLAALLWRQLSAASISQSFVWLAPIAAAAFYMRYGAIIGITALAIAAAVVGADGLWIARRTVLATIGLLVLLLVPHMVMSTSVDGTPWGIVARAQGAANEAGSFPITQYIEWFPSALLGPAGAVVAATGVASAVAIAFVRLACRSAPGEGKFAGFVAVAVLVQMAALGTVIHAETRYVFFPMILLVILGAVLIGPRLSAARLDRRVRDSLGLLSVLAVGYAIGSAIVATADESTRRTAAYAWKREAGTFVGERSPGGSCSILASDVPIVSWYSRCPAVGFAAGTQSDRLPLLTGSDRFVVVRADGHLQSTDEFVRRVYLPHLGVVQTYFGAGGEVIAVLYFVRDSA